MKKTGFIISILVLSAIALFYFGRKTIARYKNLLGKTKDWTGKALTRGERNNNCGNLKYSKTRNWQGRVIARTDDTFEQFVQFRYGTLAMIILLTEYINQGLTLRKIIYRYAPPSENNSAWYLQTVQTKSGLQLDSSLYPDKNTLKGLVMAMTFVENGHSIADQDFNEGFALLTT